MSNHSFSSITLLFPGQGSQYVGMYQALLENGVPLAIVQRIFNEADTVLAEPLSDLTKNGPLADLSLTQNTQPAIITHTYAQLTFLREILKDKKRKIDLVLGHSVGEYGALLASEVLTFSDAIKLVRNRGKFMQESVLDQATAMYAIIKVPLEIVSEGCKQVNLLSKDSLVVPANFNEPLQTVVSGHQNSCDKLIEWLKSNFQGTFKSVKLTVSAPFHSPLMQQASVKMANVINQTNFYPLKIPYIANINAKQFGTETDVATIKNNLIEQICGTVHWVKSIEALPENTLCIEVGPSKILQGLVKRIRPELTLFSLDQPKSFIKLTESYL
ncbi:MAG: ACP S-malonyltransferase [Bacteriovoracaceae bacterium]